MIKNIVIGVLAVTTLLFGYASFGGHALGAASGPAHYQVESFLQGLTAGARDQFSVSNSGVLSTTGDGTISGGTFTVTTSNTATSTISVGCVQFYATSTATAQKFQASTTPGIMYSQYGTCPNL